YSPSSVAVFGRDREGTTMWWCDATGRPTYPVFRDGTRDIAAELPCEYLAPHFPGGSAPSSTGFCYHRLGVSNGQPNYYERKRALDEAAELAFAFMRSLQDRAAARANSMDRPALFVAAYDLHRFGRAWFEGPEFLDYVFRKIHFDQDALEMITPGDYLHRHPCNQMTAPAMASWSEDGYFQEWINEDNAWAHRHLARAARVMHRITVASGSNHGSDGNVNGNGNGHEPGHNGELRSRALRVAGRQLV
ncbi:unnamed protein product, partial [marine sediment metagenome]